MKRWQTFGVCLERELVRTFIICFLWTEYLCPNPKVKPSGNARPMRTESSSVASVEKTPGNLNVPSDTWSCNRQMMFISIFSNYYYLCFIDCRVEILHMYLYFILYCVYHYVKQCSRFPLDSDWHCIIMWIHWFFFLVVLTILVIL